MTTMMNSNELKNAIRDAAVDALLSDFDNPMHLAVLPRLGGGLQALMSFDF